MLKVSTCNDKIEAIPEPTNKWQSRKHILVGTYHQQDLRAWCPLPTGLLFSFLLNNWHLSNVSSPAHVPRYYLLFHHWTVIFRLVPVFQESPKGNAKHSVFPAFCRVVGCSQRMPFACFTHRGLFVSVWAPGTISPCARQKFILFLYVLLLNYFFLVLSPVLLQMFLQLHLFKSQPAERRHM